MILITGASGNTGRAVLKALYNREIDVRVLVHRDSQVEQIRTLGAKEIVVGDMLNLDDMVAAYAGVDAVYHICSVFNPHEVEIGKVAIQAAQITGLKHFVYHSVLHSILHEMQHHEKKHVVEELLINSSIPYTIVQPAAFMQNLLESFDSLRNDGIFVQKLYTTDYTKMNLLDLNDLGEAVAHILTDESYIGGTYELCGPENLSLKTICTTFKDLLNREITVRIPPDEALEILKQ